ncbi:hypothetical protein J4E89_001804 [Alternaria sp. Ai002NY15]|nr:hypothetical protein J4E89_001804 [Alternaria sp. Ai002NY15]
MENDLTDTSTAIGPGFFGDMAKISEHAFERADARHWASRRIRFLVYDDSDVKLDDFDSDDEEGKEEYAINMSLGNHKARDPEGGGEVPNAKGGSVAEHSEQANKSTQTKCRVCASYPEFPHRWKPRKFRLVNPVVDHPEWFSGNGVSLRDICIHYVAVSYCWPPRGENPTPRTYTVRDLDGRVRASRALDDVLDRAVDFATSYGFRMIWIDQECLPQPTETSFKEDWEEQELGIQSMDIVYNRAVVTAGLLDVEITSQEQLTAIESLLYPGRTGKRSVIDRRFCEQILDFLHRTSQDRWYTRAWVVQESICAGNGLMLSFRRGPGITFQSSFRFGRAEGEDLRPYHSLDDNRGSWESKLVCIHLRGFWRILDQMRSLLTRDFVHMGNYLARSGLGSEEVYPGARSVLEIADRLHPRTEKANTINQIVQAHTEGFYGKRPTINAAGALTLLKHRECYFNADRLAIIANMCDYDFRLDTRKVNANCHSLRLAILALAVSNGDLSLLVPEAYLPEGHESQGDIYAGSVSSSNLFQKIFLEAHRIEYCEVRDYINIRLQTSRQGRFTAEGMLLHSYLWSVEREIDFSPIQAEWADIWDSYKCWVILFERQKDETVEQARARQVAFLQRFNQPNVATQAIQDFRRWGHIPNESSVWGNLDHTGIQVKRKLDAKRVQQVPEMRDTIAHIVFGVLRYIRYTLAASEEEGELMKGLANSIWHSVRTDQVPDSQHQLPDEVDDTLFAHPDVVNRPFATLQLDETLEASLAQLWFIDRIMQHGRLWCGTYTPPKQPARLTSPPDSHLQTTFEEDLQAHNDQLSAIPSSMRSVVSRQLARQFLTVAIESDLAKNGKMGGTRHTMVTYPEILRRDLWSDRKERLRERTLLAAFDVDGPCLVATPYDPEREVLPRPKLRSTSTCWVVEVKEDGCGGAVGMSSEVEDAAPGVMGYDAADGTEAGGKGKERAVDNSPETEPDMETDDAKARKLLERRDLDLCVLRKVKGLWWIMDLPSQVYLFS